jgi:branched-subunit amino acid transport protein AzlD
MVAVSAVITWAQRALPFAVLAPMRRAVVVRHLSVHMPVGIMLILAVYTLATHCATRLAPAPVTSGRSSLRSL